MLTIIKSSALERLRALAAQADTAQTGEGATRTAMEKLAEQAHADAGALRRAQAEAVAARTDTERVEKLLSRQAVEAAGDRLRAADTIRELRAALEQARMQAPAVAGLPEHTVLQFRTVGGGLVALTERPDAFDEDLHHIGWECVTCGDNGSAYYPDDGRRWANEHAAECRALPAVPAVRPVAEKTTTTL